MKILTLFVTPLIFGLSFILPLKGEPVLDNNLDLNPQIIEESPTLQKWLQEPPNVLDSIENDPSFRTRIRVGYSQFPSSHQSSGINIGVEDIFLDKTSFTIRGDYQTNFENRHSGGVDLQYYVLPLGWYVNVAPIVGYRYLDTQNYHTDGLNLGGKLILPLSRNGAADITLMQTFVSPGSTDEVGISTLSVGYAVTNNLRIATDIQKENSRVQKDSRVSFVLEWIP